MYQNVDNNKPKYVAQIVSSAFVSPSSIRRCGNETKPDHVPCPMGRGKDFDASQVKLQRNLKINMGWNV